MSEGDAPGRPDDGEDVRTDIMAATYRALCEHGYAGLTTQAIADELGKSTALLHYYYDTKEGLLVAFLEYLLDRFEETVATSTATDPGDQLADILEALLYGPADYEEYHVAMVELRSQAPYDDAIRDQLRRNDREVRELVAEVIERGIDEGVFQPVDPDRTATYLLSVVDGARTRWVVLGDDAILETVLAELRASLEDRLLAGDRELAVGDENS